MSGAEGQSVRFAGYAALFDRIDRGGDIIRRGAFAKALAALGKQNVPLFWQHRPDQPIGEIEALAEDERGLRVIGRITADAREPAALVRQGTVNGLSFGYRVRASRGRNPRELTDLDLVEVSLVTYPMQPAARVHAVEE